MTGLNVDITADTRQFQAEVENVPQSLQKISDELNSVTKAGDTAGTSLESSMRGAQQQTAESATVFRDYTSTVVAGAQEQTNAFELSNREVNKIQKETLATTGKSLAQTVEQSAQAFDGTVNGALNALQNITTGLAVFGGPELAVAAGAASLLVAGITGAVQKSQADIKLEAQAVSDLTKDLEKLGVTGVGSVDEVNKKLETFSTTTDGSDQDLEALRKTAQLAGVDFVTYARAVAGSTTDQKKLYDQVQKQIAVLDAQSKAYDGSTNSTTSNYGSLQKQLAGLQAVSDELEKNNSNLSLSKDRVNDLAAAQKESAVQAEDAAAAQADYETATKAAFDNIGQTLGSEQDQINSQIASAQQALDTAIANSAGKRTKAVIKAEQDLTDAESQQNKDTAQAFLDQQTADLQALENANQAKIQIYEKFGTDAVQVIKDAGDNANLLQSLAAANPDQVEAIMANYRQLGHDAADNLVDDAQRELSARQLTTPTLIPELDLSQVKAEIDAFTRSTYYVKLQANLNGKLIQ